MDSLREALVHLEALGPLLETAWNSTGTNFVAAIGLAHAIDMTAVITAEVKSQLEEDNADDPAGLE